MNAEETKTPQGKMKKHQAKIKNAQAGMKMPQPKMKQQQAITTTHAKISARAALAVLLPTKESARTTV